MALRDCGDDRMAELYSRLVLSMMDQSHCFTEDAKRRVHVWAGDFKTKINSILSRHQHLTDGAAASCKQAHADPQFYGIQHCCPVNLKRSV